MAHILIEYNGDPESASIILNHNGFVMLFPSEQEAYEFALKQLGFDWKIVEIEKRTPKL